MSWGSGSLRHCHWMRSFQWPRWPVIDGIDIHGSGIHCATTSEEEFKEKFDAVWCSHCLEHQLDVNIFLKKIHDITKENGIVGITVPPLKHEIVGGHVSLWNAGLLLYNLVLAGFDCSESKIKSYDYNISVILRKRSILLPQLVFDRGDLVALRNFFPKDLQKDQWGHFDGQIQQLNWD